MYTLHPWHGVNPGNEAPASVNAVIEIPKGSHCKYELDKRSGLLKFDRAIYSSFHYPVNYGFIPQTIGDDGDPLDIMVISNEQIQPLCILEAKVIGNMPMTDNGEKENKIIAVAARDPLVNQYQHIDELPEHFIRMLRNYFEQYKVLEKKTVVIETFQHKETAYLIIETAIQLYREKFTAHQ